MPQSSVIYDAGRSTRPAGMSYILFAHKHCKYGKKLYFCKIMPSRIPDSGKSHNERMGKLPKIRNNHILAACVLLLVIVCFLSVYRPIRFNSELEAREAAIKERLIKIRQAEERYRKANGTYAGDFATLVKSGYMADSLQFIPFSNGERFELGATTVILKSGHQVPLMECGAQYRQYLGGLDENSIANLIEAADKAGRYPGLKIGDLTTYNYNAGNWE